MAVEHSPRASAHSVAAPSGTDQDLLGEASFDTAPSFIDATPLRFQRRLDPAGTSSALMADSALGVSFGASAARRQSSADLLGRHDAGSGRHQEAFLSSTPATQPGAASRPEQPGTTVNDYMIAELARLGTVTFDTGRALKATTSSAAAAHAAIDDLRLQLRSDRDMAARQAEAYSNAIQLHHQRMVALFDSVEANSEAIQGLQKSVANTSESVIALEQALSDAVAKATKTANAALAQASATAALQAAHPVQALGSSVDSRPALTSGPSVDARSPAKLFADNLGSKLAPFQGFVMVDGSMDIDWMATHAAFKPFVLAIEMAYGNTCESLSCTSIPMPRIFGQLLNAFQGAALQEVTTWYGDNKADALSFTFNAFLEHLRSTYTHQDSARIGAKAKLASDFPPLLCHGWAPQDWVPRAEALFKVAGHTEQLKIDFILGRLKAAPSETFSSYAAIREYLMALHTRKANHKQSTALATAEAAAAKALEPKSKPSPSKTAAAPPRSWSSSSPKAATPAPSGNNSASETRKAASPAATADHAGRSPSQRPPHSKVGRIAAKAKAPGNGSGSRSLETVSSFSDDGTQYSDADEEE